MSVIEIFENCAKQCMHCTSNTLLPYDYEWGCFASGCIVFKKKSKFSKTSKKKITFINRLKYAEKQIICKCIDV